MHFFRWIALFALPLWVQAVESEPAPPAQVNALSVDRFWKFHKWGALGYRRDRQRFSDFVNGEVNSSTHYKDRNTLQAIIGSHMEYNWFLMHFRGTFGWLLSGACDYSLPGNFGGPNLNFNNFKLGAGYSAEASGAVAVRWTLYRSSNFQFALIPWVGYRYSHLMNFAEGEKRYAIPGTFNYALCRLPTPNQQDWFGPYVEGRLEFRHGENVEWSLFYQYHRPFVSSKSKAEVDLYTYGSGGALAAAELSRVNSIVKASAVCTQLGGFDLKLHYASGWTFGGYFEGSSTWTDRAHAHIQRKTQDALTIGPAEKTSYNESAAIRWARYQASLLVGYRF